MLTRGAVAAVLSDHQTPAQGVQRPDGICVTESQTVGTERASEQDGLPVASAASIRPSAAIHRLPTATGQCKSDNQPCPDVDVGVAAACEQGAAQLGHPLGLPDG